MPIKPSDISIQVPDTEEGQEIRELIATVLYTNGILTKSQAIEMLGNTIREFHEILVKHRLPLSNHKTKEVLDMYTHSLDR